ncbi:MAG: tRNA 2-thiouridine(34) synthase MnmA [Patescibacteria group bacterium]
MRRKKVLVGMSGGVDSSVSAFLLKKDGYDVSGVFMRLANSKKSFNAEKEARGVAKKLGVPFVIFDLSKEFKKIVIDYFIDSYGLGITPNPCVLCNKEIKFGLLLRKAMSLGADYLATGHYVIKQRRGSGYKLFKSKDSKKDQSYFLWRLNQKQLSKVLFPVGGLIKERVREIARKNDFLKKVGKESEDICFIEKDIVGFLKDSLKMKEGDIINEKNEKIGRHSGLFIYTIGQRKNIRVSSSKPYYVRKIDIKKNILFVTSDEKDLYAKKIKVKNMNWLSKNTKFPIKVLAKTRYGHEGARAVVDGNMIEFVKAQRAITPGQSIVFYKGQELLGGGIISEIK